MASTVASGASAHTDARGGEQHEAGHEHALAAEAVAERAAEQEEGRERHEIRVERPLQARHIGVQVAADRGQRDVDDRAVEKGDARTEHSRRDHPAGGRVPNRSSPPLVIPPVCRASGCPTVVRPPPATRRSAGAVSCARVNRPSESPRKATHGRRRSSSHRSTISSPKSRRWSEIARSRPERLQKLEVTLDQCWDLLRQRRARREFGLDPDVAAPRDPNTVENYKQ